MHDIIFCFRKQAVTKVFVPRQAGCIREGSELGADDKIDARNKQGSSVVETDRFQEISGRNPDH